MDFNAVLEKLVGDEGSIFGISFNEQDGPDRQLILGIDFTAMDRMTTSQMTEQLGDLVGLLEAMKEDVTAKLELFTALTELVEKGQVREILDEEDNIYRYVAVKEDAADV